MAQEKETSATLMVTVAPFSSRMLTAKHGGTAGRGGVTQRSALLKECLGHFLNSVTKVLKAEDRKACVIELTASHTVLPSEPEQKAKLVPDP